MSWNINEQGVGNDLANQVRREARKTRVSGNEEQFAFTDAVVGLANLVAVQFSKQLIQFQSKGSLKDEQGYFQVTFRVQDVPEDYGQETENDAESDDAEVEGGAGVDDEAQSSGTGSGATVRDSGRTDDAGGKQGSGAAS
jgi:hypothetical protein